MRLYPFLLIALLLSQIAFAGKKLRVLFIGNSYTYYNNMPQVTADIAASMGDTLLFDSYTVGGYRFADHSYDTNCINKIRSAKWDYVILQEQSQQPSQPTSGFFTYSYHWAWFLDTVIAANDPCTKTMFYMTWGYKNGDSNSCKLYPTWPYVCTYEGMDSLTNLRYRAYADTSLPPAMGYPLSGTGWFQPIRPSEVSPVGAVRHYIRHNYPSIELYRSDESHPTEAGSYVSACTFYMALFHKNPTLISYNYTLGSTDASNIRAAVKLVGYDSMSKWYIGLRYLRAAFDHAAIGSNTVEFANHSANATNYTWHLGDGNTTHDPSPTHTYAAGGFYLVRLIAENASCSDTTYEWVSTYPASVNTLNNQSSFTIAPNPAHDFLSIDVRKLNGSYNLYLLNSVGQIVYKEENGLPANKLIDIKAFNRGAYLLIITNNGNSYHQQLSIW